MLNLIKIYKIFNFKNSELRYLVLLEINLSSLTQNKKNADAKILFLNTYLRYFYTIKISVF